MKNAEKTTCMVCVVTPDFMMGALTMLHSFLKHNRWFNDDIIILHEGLSDTDKDKLQALYPRLVLKMVSDDIAHAVDSVIARRPDMRHRYASFFKGDLLNFTQYQRIIMSDCDMMYTGSIEDLLTNAAPLQACADGAHYAGVRRSKNNYNKLEYGSNEPSLKSTFSAGFMIFKSDILGSANFTKFIATMDQYSDTDFTSGNTDQAIFNVMFDGLLSRLSCIYNYHLMHKNLIQRVTGVHFEEAVIIHYGGSEKPWQPHAVLKVAAQDDDLRIAFDLWRVAYASYRKDPEGKFLSDKGGLA